MTENSGSGGGKGKLILWIVIFAVVVILLYVFVFGPSGLLGGEANLVEERGFQRDSFELVLRPADLDISYTIQNDGRLSNEVIIGRMTALIGKTYILETGRVDGWDLYMEKTSNSKIGPSAYRSKVEFFETAAGASKAFDKDWFWVNIDPDNDPDYISEKSCDFGDECLFITYDKVIPGSGIANVEYNIGFRFNNVLIQVLVKGADFETKDNDALDAAQLILDSLKEIE